MKVCPTCYGRGQVTDAPEGKHLEDVLVELAMANTPAERCAIIASALNRARITRAQALHLLDAPVSTSATEKK